MEEKKIREILLASEEEIFYITGDVDKAQEIVGFLMSEFGLK